MRIHVRGVEAAPTDDADEEKIRASRSERLLMRNVIKRIIDIEVQLRIYTQNVIG